MTSTGIDFQRMVRKQKILTERVRSENSRTAWIYCPDPEYGSGNIRVCLNETEATLLLIDCTIKAPLSLYPNQKNELYITSFHEVTGHRMSDMQQVSLCPGRVNIATVQSGISRTTFEAGSRICGFVLVIRPNEYKKHLESILHTENCRLLSELPALDQKVQDPSISAISRSMFHFHGDEISSRLFYRGKVDEIISILISRHPGHQVSTAGQFVDASQSQDLAEVEKVIQYMSAHLSEPLTESQLARRFCSSPSRLSAMFKRVTSRSLPEFRNQLRVSEARRLLTETNLTQKEIAARLGFSRASNFSDFFRRMTGEVPGALRKECPTPPQKCPGNP